MARITSIAERPRALMALALAGSTWGLTLPLAAIAIRSVSPGWLASMRFGLAALLLALMAGRGSLRAAFSTRIVGWGVFGYAGVILLQGEAIERTSVSHAAVLGGIVPALVVLIAMVRGGRRPSFGAAVGLLGAVGGVVLFAGGGGGHASLEGDGLVLIASVCSAIYIVAQPPLLAGRSPIGVTAVQMGAASLASLPFALLGEPTPHIHEPALLALLGLVVIGSLLPFTLYAWGQTRVPGEVAGAFLNLEALVGGIVGVLAFHDPWGLGQTLGMTLMLAGIALVVAKAPRPAAARSEALVARRVGDAGEVAIEHLGEHRLGRGGAHEQRHRRAQLLGVDRAEDRLRVHGASVGENARALEQPRPQ
jgi:O-acetylserine/cysteine efflux transporter